MYPQACLHLRRKRFDVQMGNCISGYAYDEIDAAGRLSEHTEAQMGTPRILNHPDAFQFNRLAARLLEQA